MTDVDAACTAARMVKKAFALPIGKIIAGALLAMPPATYLLNRIRGYDPQKAMKLPEVPAMRPIAHGALAARLALQRALRGLKGPNPLLQSAQGLRSYRGVST